MATKNATNPTLLDVASRYVDGAIPLIVEQLSQTNEILQDLTMIECNDGSTHRTTIRSGLPTPTWRKLNYGVQPSKSRTVQVRDATGMLEIYAKVDKALADMNGNAPAFRASEDAPFIEALSQEWAKTLFYGDTNVSPEKFMGLDKRYNDTTAECGDNILKGGGGGNANTSVWLMISSPTTVHGLYPKGSPAGITQRDLGEDTDKLSDGSELQIYRTHYKLDAGFTVRDWRYVVRICNIDTAALKKDAATGDDLIDLMTQALEIPPMLNAGRAAFYCNRTIRSYLRRQIRNSKNMYLTMDQVAGKRVLSFDEVPVRRCDQILNTEATYS